MRYVAVAVLIAVGPGLLASVPVFVARRRRFLARAVATVGTVAACDWEKMRDGGGDTYRLTVRFQGPDGRELTLTEGGRGETAVGARVDVLYDPDRPERAHVAYGTRYIRQMAAGMVVAGSIGSGLLWLALGTWTLW
jgi:hypothetical protein